MVSVLDSETNVLSSTYITKNRSDRVPDEKVTVRWITNSPVDLGEFSLRANWGLLNLRSLHLYSSVSEKAIIRNRYSTRGHAVFLFDTHFEVNICLNLDDDELDYALVVHVFDC